MKSKALARRAASSTYHHRAIMRAFSHVPTVKVRKNIHQVVTTQSGNKHKIVTSTEKYYKYAQSSVSTSGDKEMSAEAAGVQNIKIRTFVHDSVDGSSSGGGDGLWVFEEATALKNNTIVPCATTHRSAALDMGKESTTN